MDAYLIIVYVASACSVTFLFLPVLIKLLSEWRIFDAPGKHKIHQHYVPSMGGICILLGVGFSLLIGLPFSKWAESKFFFIAIGLMFVTGLRDDILTLTPREKLIGQILPVIIVVVFGDTVLWSLYGVAFHSFVFPIALAWPLTVFTVVILVNAYNLIDGLDGLAGTIGVMTASCFGVWFYLSGNYTLSLISLSFAGAILAFLFFNWQPSKIFMGDTGALVIGLLLSVLSISFLNDNHALPQGSAIKFQASIGTVLCVMIVPVFDTLRVIVLRLRKLQSPFKADHNHLHHQFLELGFSHAQTVFFIGGINLVFILLALILRNQSDAVILSIALIVCLTINQALKVARKKYDIHRGKSSVPQN